MKSLAIQHGAALLLAVAPLASAQRLIGYGNTPYNPLCAEACRRSFASMELHCMMDADDDADTGHGHSHGLRRRHTMPATTPECYATDEPWLTSVAYCMSTRCAEQGGVPDSLIQEYWEYWMTGTKAALLPKWSYAQALAQVKQPPKVQLAPTDMILNETSLVPPGTYLAQFNVLGAVRHGGELEATYGLAILFLTAGVPILITCLSWLPFMGRLADKVKPYLWTSTIGRFQVRPLPFLLGNAPTVGQAIFVVFLLAINLGFGAASYSARQPSAWYPTAAKEIAVFIMYRTGSFAFTLYSLVLLFSSRNNVLLWLTNWSHSTYLLAHRWLGRFCMLHIVIHSILGLQNYAASSGSDWWNWGVAATVLSVAIVLFSGLYVRQAHYELFLISHIVLTVLILVGSWYHVIMWYASMHMTAPDTSGYEVWLYIAFAVWAFDRVVRVGRILKVGVRRSVVTDLGNGYIRADVPGVRWGTQPGQHAYFYFPTLVPWRGWENHPFSVVPTSMLLQQPPPQPPKSGDTLGRGSSAGHGSASSSRGGPDEEKQVSQANAQPVSASGGAAPCGTAGITVLIKKGGGITKHLKADASLVTLLEGPYHNSTHAASRVLRCDRVVLIGGGIGITGLLPWRHMGHANVRLCWSVKDSAQCLVNAVGLGGGAALHDNHVDIRVGSRFDVNAILAEEVAAGWGRIGVVVAGPGSLCDDVRAAVAAAGRKASKTAFELEVDAYSW